MKKLLKISIVAAMLSVLFSVCVKADDGNWAIYMYVCGSDLESDNGYATKNILALMNSGRTEDTIIVAQTGGTSEWKNNFASAEKTQRWLYTEGNMVLVDEQELSNMGDADTLADFLEFASTNYPAEHTMVLFWDHGGGTLSGCCMDENFDDDMLSLAEMHDAFSRVYSLSEEEMPIDIIGFDCCLMSTIDVADTFKDTAHYLVASEEVEPCDGWDFESIGDCLGENPTISPLDLGVEICDSYYNRLQRIDQESFTAKAESATLSLTDLTQINKLTAAFNSYIDTLIVTAYDDPEFFRSYSIFAKNSENYGGNSRAEGYRDLADIHDFVLNCNEYIPGGDDVLTALDDCVVYKVNGNYRPSGGGLSFYFDYDGKQDKNNNYTEVGSVDALKALYDFGLSDEIDESTIEYMQQLGLDTENIPEVKTLAHYESNATPIQFNEDGIPYADFGEEAAPCMTDAMYYVYRVEDGKTYFIGSDDEVACDFATGIVFDQMAGNWAYFDGHLASMELIYDSAEYHLYTTPVKIYGKEYRLQVGFNSVTNEWALLGACVPQAATAMTSRALYIEEGTEVTLLYEEVAVDGSYITVEGPSFTYNRDTSFEFQPLADGQYAIQYVIEDLYTNLVFSNYVVFDMIDGQRTFDTEATIPLSELPAPTAEQAAQDGEVHKATMTIINNTDTSITYFCVAVPDDENTYKNLLVDPIEPGTFTGNEDYFYSISYNADSLLWEVRAVDGTGAEHSFDLDLSNCDAENITIEFWTDDEGSWKITY